jgi:hypothetical protein
VNRLTFPLIKKIKTINSFKAFLKLKTGDSR